MSIDGGEILGATEVGGGCDESSAIEFLESGVTWATICGRKRVSEKLLDDDDDDDNKSVFLYIALAISTSSLNFLSKSIEEIGYEVFIGIILYLYSGYYIFIFLF